MAAGMSWGRTGYHAIIAFFIATKNPFVVSERNRNNNRAVKQSGSQAVRQSVKLSSGAVRFCCTILTYNGMAKLAQYYIRVVSKRRKGELIEFGGGPGPHGEGREGQGEMRKRWGKGSAHQTILLFWSHRPLVPARPSPSVKGTSFQ